jgi:hypothetical protein
MKAAALATRLSAKCQPGLRRGGVSAASCISEIIISNEINQRLNKAAKIFIGNRRIQYKLSVKRGESEKAISGAGQRKAWLAKSEKARKASRQQRRHGVGGVSAIGVVSIDGGEENRQSAAWRRHRYLASAAAL